jgi:hypothetical protein
MVVTAEGLCASLRGLRCQRQSPRLDASVLGCCWGEIRVLMLLRCRIAHLSPAGGC